MKHVRVSTGILPAFPYDPGEQGDPMHAEAPGNGIGSTRLESGGGFKGMQQQDSCQSTSAGNMSLQI
jgi:hypothetical protein